MSRRSGNKRVRRLLYTGGVATVGALAFTATNLSTTSAAPEGAQHRAADTITTDRATVRDYPGRLVLSNARAGDRAEVNSYCGGWVRISVNTDRAMATNVGWVLRGHLAEAGKAGGLDGVPERCGKDESRWRDWVGAINSPFQSLRKLGENRWTRVTYGTRATLTPTAECTPSMNYTRHADAPDEVDPGQRVEGLNMENVGYRYVTSDGAVALVSAPRLDGGKNVWSFVPASCVQPRGDRSKVYFDEPVVQLENINGLKGGVEYGDQTLRERKCTAAVPAPNHPGYGYWPDPEKGSRPECTL
ncbi:hypothetical protein SLNWT_6950 [Streptomyces albus]|uniref:SH3 domain-containing protein n=1 Tax=Streptomyces albus (strain ATCC 21838 / DSM 41398 / FERM P-419 / JCM 4703 / NBRC 107858) TaxID=1081613 RepID=A0A0B5F924_STRA4|nr:hypothetical protein SLNWT_6950 [Streptomyces albus]AOU81629.1 hypothetical protein SLNHY_6938 [Streptomyces albus]AYN37320.1 hypothetical protein DUI70_6827 [Streptomyces albus]